MSTQYRHTTALQTKRLAMVRISRTLHSFQQDKQCIYNLNIEALSSNHSFRRKAKIITYSECVFAALVIHNAMGMRRTVICGLSGYTIAFYIITYTADL